MEQDIASAGEPALGRAQRRLLRRIYNGRTVPIVADGRAFLTYRDATRHLLSLDADARNAVYEAMKAAAGPE
jgi:hypothetical protein